MEQFMFKKILILLCVQTFLMITSDLIYAQDYIKLIKKDNSEINIDLTTLKSIRVENITSVENIDMYDIQMYPNPANTKVNINLASLQNLQDKKLVINIYDSNHKLIKRLKDINSQIIEIDLVQLNITSGVYFIEILDNSQNINTSKLIIE